MLHSLQSKNDPEKKTHSRKSLVYNCSRQTAPVSNIQTEEHVHNAQ